MSCGEIKVESTMKCNHSNTSNLCSMHSADSFLYYFVLICVLILCRVSHRSPVIQTLRAGLWHLFSGWRWFCFSLLQHKHHKQRLWAWVQTIINSPIILLLQTLNARLCVCVCVCVCCTACYNVIKDRIGLLILFVNLKTVCLVLQQSQLSNTNCLIKVLIFFVSFILRFIFSSFNYSKCLKWLFSMLH